MRRHEFSEKDLQKIKEWVKQANIHWGQDGGHRHELLSSEYMCLGMLEKGSAATWEHGLESLLLSIIGGQGETASSIEFSQSELLSKLWKLIRSLREDLIPLSDGSRRNLENWTSYLDCLLNAYFCPDPFNGEEQDDFAFLAEQLSRLHQANGGLSEDDFFSFVSLLPHLKNTLGQESLNYNEKHLQSVRFCSLLPMRAIPSRVICLLGLEDPLYPRREYRSSLDLRAGSADVDYCPSKSDYDRYLFLESLLSARDYFILTYQGRALSDGKEQLPSILITELLSYADKFFTIGGELPSGKIVKHHPHAPYHYSYFDPQSSFLSYSNVRYLEACAAYAPSKHEPHRFIPHFYIGSEKKALDEFPHDQVVVDLRKLSQCVSKPLQLYLNQSMGIYLKEDDQVEIDEEPFVCTALDHWQYKQAYLNHSLDAMLARDSRSGKLPLGLWKEAAVQSIEKNVLLLENNAKAMGIAGERLLKINFIEKCRRSYKCSENHWILPARELLIGDIQVKFTGSLSGISSKGFVASREAKFVDVAKLLPAWLALHLVPEECVDLKEKNLLLCGDGKILTFPGDSQDLLSSLFNYYFSCLTNPCPILPEWIQSVLKGDAAELQNKISGSFSDRGGTFDRYSCWIIQRGDLPDAEAIMNLWQGPVAALFGGIQGLFSKGDGDVNV
jgi:exodeoxyribonuclease V gamma subunit